MADEQMVERLEKALYYAEARISAKVDGLYVVTCDDVYAMVAAERARWLEEACEICQQWGDSHNGAGESASAKLLSSVLRSHFQSASSGRTQPAESSGESVRTYSGGGFDFAELSSTPKRAVIPWCTICKEHHQPTPEHVACEFDPLFLHEPVPANIYIEFRGWRFTPPFICMGCGIEVCHRQWAFSRSCGGCDVSNSRTRRLLYGKCFAGPHELVGPIDSSDCIPPGQFVDPKDRNKYPVTFKGPPKLYRGRRTPPRPQG